MKLVITTSKNFINLASNLTFIKIKWNSA